VFLFSTQIVFWGKVNSFGGVGYFEPLDVTGLYF